MSGKSNTASSEGKSTEEPIKVSNVYDTTQLKHALDDELVKVINKETKYSQSHQHTDVKLFLGYISVLIAGGSFLYEYKYGFNYARWGTLGCVISFWFLQAAIFMYTKFVESNEIYVGYTYDGLEHTGTLSVTSVIDRHSSNYKIIYLYTDVKGRKHSRLEKTASVALWFKEDGTLIESEFDKYIKESVHSVAQLTHKD